MYRERHLDDDGEVLVAKFDYKEFVWWSDYLKNELPVVYKEVLERLMVAEEDYGFELHGFTCFRHKEDKNRRCDVKHVYLPQIECGKYHPYTSVKHKRRACMRTLERLEHLEKRLKKSKNKFDYLVTLDLTLPKNVSLRWYDEETQVGIRKVRKRFLELLHNELFPKYKSDFGVNNNDHYWSTQHPLEPHRHLHLNIPNVCYSKSKKRFYRFKPYLDEGMVKGCWRKALVEHGLWDKENSAVPVCRVGYIKFSDRNRVIHRLSYCCRKPTEDMMKNLKREDLENFENSREFARFLIDYTPRVVNLGFLTNLKRFGFNSNKSIAMICPICGGEMVAWRDEFGVIRNLDRPPPHTSKLLRGKKGNWWLLSE